MFRLVTIASFLVWILCASWFYFFQMKSTEKRRALYEKLVQESKELASKKALEKEPAHQLRRGVQKDIWTLNDKERLHFRLKSKGSHLTIQQAKEKIYALERLQDLECWLQEEINRKEGWQQIRYLTAEEGTYAFPSHQFVADWVNIAFYQLPGSELPISLQTSPFLVGTAQEVVFSAADKVPTFNAHHLKATFESVPKP